MMRLFSIVVLVLTSFSTSALAEGENSISVSGHFRLRAEGSHLTDLTSDRDSMLLRIRPEIKFTRDANLDVVLTPQFSKTFGDVAYTPTSATSNAATTTSSVTYDPSFSVHEGYANYRPFDWFGLKAGRMVFSYGDELVIGALDWHNIGRSFDGARLRFTSGLGTSDLIFSKITDRNIVAGAVGYVDFYGIYNSFDFGTYFKNVDLYLLNKTDTTGAAITQLGAAGLRVASKFDGIDYRAEYTKEFGNAFTDSGSAYQIDIEGGYTFDASLKPRIAAEYFNAGKSYNQLFPTIHKWLGYADVLSRRNISGFVIHADAQVLEKLKAKLDFHSFTRVDVTDAVYGFTGARLGTAAGSTSNTVGSEVDLTLVYNTTKDLSFSGGGAYFNSGSYLKDQFGSKNPMFYYLQMDVKL